MSHISNCKKQTFSDALFSYIFYQNQANFCLEFLTLNLCASIVVSFTVFGNDGFTSVSVRGILFCPRVLFIGHCISFCFKSLSFSFLYLHQGVHFTRLPLLTGIVSVRPNIGIYRRSKYMYNIQGFQNIIIFLINVIESRRGNQEGIILRRRQHEDKQHTI